MTDRSHAGRKRCLCAVVSAQVPLLYVHKCRWAPLNVFLKDSVTGTGIYTTLL